MLTIGVVGSQQFIAEISKYYGHYPTYKLISYTYTSPRELNTLIERAVKECNFLLFSGIIPYHYAKKQLDQYPIGSSYLSFNENMVALSLLAIHYHHSFKLSEMSIDLPRKRFLEGVLNEAGITEDADYVKEYPWIYDFQEERQLSIEDFVEFHSVLYEQKKTAFALTSIHAVYDKLQAKGIPSMFMVQSVPTLMEGLEKATTLAKLNQSKNSQVAAVCFNSNRNDQLEHFAKALQAKVTPSDSGLQMVLSNRGVLQTLILNQKLADLLNDTTNDFEKTAVGIGYGYTVKEAETHAITAFDFAEKNRSKLDLAVYLLDEEKKLTGPLFQNEEQYSLKNEDPVVKKLSAELKMSSKNISRFINFLQVNDFRPFSSQELADYFSISRRSAERMIKKLLDQQSLQVAGEEQPYDQGRPRSLYQAGSMLKGLSENKNGS
ncbi:hypothetical protein DFO73_102454 [Cytobacillus oceanisediminis]|uniref:Transcriptional regulator n=1 Tax=Cytobacillus oceanisediminis TaxID=665099 RepID=A0A2V3A4V7_9BACI|nr:hypothetical protein [Cytobacillus oceanisediminis]PWW31455.1 hypothetical protein DFO73_102454 [Cytobacillus oceanisediminis]